MFRHLLKLIWKRKSRNMMLSLEILLAFVLVFAVAAFGTRCYQLYHIPIGFQYDDVWSVSMQTPGDKDILKAPETYENFRHSLLAMPEVEQLAFSSFSPFAEATMRFSFAAQASGASIESNVLEVSDEYFDTVHVALAQGRAFGKEDDGSGVTPAVINRSMATTLFGTQEALGKLFVTSEHEGKSGKSLRVVGIVEHFRDHGEFMTPTNFVIERYEPKGEGYGMRTILLKLRPGTERAFEAKLSAQLKLVRNDWTYLISPLKDLRASMLRTTLMALAVVSVIAGLFLTMVAFGLFGVLWQNTTLRIPEIGLRRAIGADSGHIYRQIIAEQMLLSSVAMLLALALLVQLPLTNALGEHLNWSVFGAASVLSMATIYLISLLCSLYPGWRASRLSPTEALHYE